MAGHPARVRAESKWANVALPTVEHEDRLSQEDASELWGKIYTLFGATSEEQRDEARLAVVAYYAANGTSSRTPHNRDVVTGSGEAVPAADLLQVYAREEIRRFMRADVDDHFIALRESGVLELDPVSVQKSMAKGIPRGFTHCNVDFLRGCSLMTPEEKIYHDKAFQTSISRANGARGGLTIEEEDQNEMDGRLERTRRSSRVRPSDDF